MPVIFDPADDASLLPGDIATPMFAPEKKVVEKPSIMDVLGAASRQNNVVGGMAYNYKIPVTKTGFGGDTYDGEAWDAADHLDGYENYASDLVWAKDSDELWAWKDRIDAQKADRDLLDRSGLFGTASEVGFSLIDPTFLVSLALPELNVLRTRGLVARAAESFGKSALSEIGTEAAMQSVQSARSIEQSGFNVATAGVAGAILGPLLNRVPKKELESIHKAIDDEIASLQPSTVGAAEVRQPTTLEREQFALGGQQFSNIQTKIPLAGTDISKVMGSIFKSDKEAMQELAAVNGILGKNLAEESTPPSVEVFALRHHKRVANFIDFSGAQWLEYAKRVPRGTRMSKDSFYEGISKASRRGDSIGIPEVDKAAAYLRKEVFDPLKEMAQKYGILKEDLEGVIGAQSYFRRMYDSKAIQKNLVEWNQTLFNWFKKTSDASDAEINAAVKDVTNKITHAEVGRSNWNTLVDVATAGPLKERTLNIPDELIEKFLINDPHKVANAYVRDLAPQVEMAKRFEGDIEMKAALSRIDDEAAFMSQRITDSDKPITEKNKLLKEIEDQRKASQEAMIRIRDRVLGVAGRIDAKTDLGRRAVQAVRGWRNLVMASKGGMIGGVSAVADLHHTIARNGFAPTMSKLGKMATSKEFRELSKSQARRVGSLVEVAMSRRAHIQHDGAITEGWTQKLAEGLFRYTGLNHFMDFNKMLAGSVFEDRVMKAALNDNLSKSEAAHLASLGLGKKELKLIREQVKQHGGDVDGTHVSGSANWDNTPIIGEYGIADIYDAAVMKEINLSVVTPGAADRVWWMDSEIGKIIGQLKTFALSSPMRQTMRAVQLMGNGQIVEGAKYLGTMLIGGYLVHALRGVASGNPIDTTPKGAFNNALTESGLMGVLPDLVDPFGRKLAPELFGKTKYGDRNLMSAFGGPGVGAGMDAWDILMNKTENGITAKELHKIRLMLPWQNALFFRRGINALEGEAAEGLDLPGATSDGFFNRLVEQK